MDLQKLAVPFRADEYEWRIGQCGEKDGGVWAKALCYVTARAVMDRLDSVCGPENWRVSYTHVAGGVMCALSIRCGEEWITKEDGAENTEMEAFKGGISGALKRAAVAWGIGRLLYNLEAGWCECSTDTRKFPQYGKTKKGTAFSWKPPELPAWALPAGAAPAPSPPEAQEGAQKPAPAPARRDDTPLLTSPQKRKIMALRRDLGLDDEQYHKGLLHHYGRESTADLSKDEASSLIERLEARLTAKLADEAGEAFGDGRLGKLRKQALGYCDTIKRQGCRYVSGEPVDFSVLLAVPGDTTLEELREMIGASGDEGELEGLIVKLEKLLEDMAF